MTARGTGNRRALSIDLHDLEPAEGLREGCGKVREGLAQVIDLACGRLFAGVLREGAEGHPLSDCFNLRKVCGRLREGWGVGNPPIGGFTHHHHQPSAGVR